MGWEDRLKEAAYTAPDGTRVRLGEYETLTQTIERRAREWSFPGVDGVFMQDLGSSGRRFPFRVFFWGGDYDQEAERFIELLQLRGIGLLEHPLYGRRNVVPSGAITRRDDLVEAAGQAVVEVAFLETLPDAYPSDQTDIAGEAAQSVEEFKEAAAGQFAADMTLDTVAQTTTFRARYEALKAAVSDRLRSIASATDSTRRQFDAINQSIDADLQTLVGDPLTLAFQTVELLKTPARSAALFRDKVAAFGELADSITASTTLTPSYDKTNENTHYTRDLFVASLLLASLDAAQAATFATKTEAIEAADVLLSQFDAWVAWRDENTQSLGVIDTGELYEALRVSVALTTGYLVELSFDLKQERAVILQNPRAVVELAAELYGEVDAVLDFFIKTNGFTGAELLQIPAGRKVVWYV